MDLISSIPNALSMAKSLLDALRTSLAEFVVMAFVAWLYVKGKKDAKQAAVSAGRNEKPVKKPPLPDKHELVINKALAHMVFQFGATRAWLFQPHNGDYNLVTGVSFRKLSMTNEAVAPGVPHCSQNWQRVPIGLLAWWYTILRECQELFIPEVDGFYNDSGQANILIENGIKGIYMIALYHLGSKDPVGFVALVYNEQPRGLNEIELANFRAIAFKICGCLLSDEDVCEYRDQEEATA